MKDKNRNFILFYILFTILMVGYIFIKTATMRFSEDEAFSVLDVLYMNFPYFFGSTPNSHLLNSLFLWIELKLFGLDQVALRLHSVFSYLIFAWAVFRLSCHIDGRYKRYLFVLLVTLHPYMIEYFSLARGYGMSIAFMMASVCFVYESIIIEKSKNKRKIYVAAFLAALSVLSCYVMLTFYISLLMVYAISLIVNDKAIISFKSLSTLFISDLYFWILNGLFLLAVMAVVVRLNPSSLRAFWPSNNFWSDTIYSIVEMFSIGTNRFTIFAFSLFTVLTVLSLVVAFISFCRSRVYQSHTFFSILFLVMYVLFMIQFYIGDINYVSYRAAIYMYPLLVLLIFWMVAESNFSRIFHVAGIYVLTALTVFVAVNFGYTFSLSRGIDTMPIDPFVEALQDLDEVRPKGKKISLGVSRAFPATIHYYKKRYHLDYIENIGFGYVSDKIKVEFYTEVTEVEKYDYFIIETYELPAVTAFQKIEILKKYPGSPMLLAKSID